MLKWDYQRAKIQPAAGDGRSSTKVVLQKVKVQPAAGDDRSSTNVGLPENENPAGRRRRPFQYQSFATRERKSSRLPATAVPVPKFCYQRTKIQPAAGDGGSSTKIQPAAGDGRSSTKVVLQENENPAGRRRRPFQYSSWLYYQRTKIQPAAGDGRSSTKVVLLGSEHPAGR